LGSKLGSDFTFSKSGSNPDLEKVKSDPNLDPDLEKVKSDPNLDPNLFAYR